MVREGGLLDSVLRSGTRFWHSRVSLTPEPESWSGAKSRGFQVYPGFSGMPAKDTVAIADFGPKPPSDSRLRARNTSRRTTISTRVSLRIWSGETSTVKTRGCCKETVGTRKRNETGQRVVREETWMDGERERSFENQQEITTLTVIWARQLVSPQPKLGPVPQSRDTREPASMSSARSGGLAERPASWRSRTGSFWMDGWRQPVLGFSSSAFPASLEISAFLLNVSFKFQYVGYVGRSR